MDITLTLALAVFADLQWLDACFVTILLHAPFAKQDIT
jgi:hypothetical protein